MGDTGNIVKCENNVCQIIGKTDDFDTRRDDTLLLNQIINNRKALFYLNKNTMCIGFFDDKNVPEEFAFVFWDMDDAKPPRSEQKELKTFVKRNFKTMQKMGAHTV